MNETITINTIIVVYNNSLNQISKLLRSVEIAFKILTNFSQPVGLNVTIVDCSASFNFEISNIIQNYEYTIDYIFANENLGHSGGCNLAGLKSESDFLFFLNPDTLLHPNTFTKIFEYLENQNADAVDCRQIPCIHPKWFNPKNGKTNWISGSSLFIKTKVFQKVSGFDQDWFPMYANDVDLSWRLQLANFNIGHVSQAVIFHDKRLDRNANVIPTLTEQKSSAEAALTLHLKYGRMDLFKHRIAELENSDEISKSIARDFIQRYKNGEIPTPIIAPKTIAYFEQGDYGKRSY